MECSPIRADLRRGSARRALASLGGLLLAAGHLCSQPADPGTPSPPPRQIAPVMSHVHADWLTRPERVQEEQPDRLVRALRIPKGATVVDLGAGVGYFTWRLARAVGSDGRVIATDIQPEMLEMLAANMRKRGVGNVTTVLAKDDDPGLPSGNVDLVLMVDVYHELSRPRLNLERIRMALSTGGRLVLVEYRDEPQIPIHPLHKMSVNQVRAEVEPAGFALVEVLGFLPSQDVIIFTPVQ